MYHKIYNTNASWIILITPQRCATAKWSDASRTSGNISVFCCPPVRETLKHKYKKKVQRSEQSKGMPMINLNSNLATFKWIITFTNVNKSCQENNNKQQIHTSTNSWIFYFIPIQYTLHNILLCIFIPQEPKMSTHRSEMEFFQKWRGKNRSWGIRCFQPALKQ